MRKLTYILALLMAVGLISCKDDPVIAGFEDMRDMTIYDYITDNQVEYSHFLTILEKAGIDKTLSAYNPQATGYTLFLPGNEAVMNFISERPEFNSLDDLLNDEAFVSGLARYHVIERSFRTNAFPFGSFPNPTLSKDYLTVSFIIEPDTSYYKINNQAAVIGPNIEVSNGYVHIVEEMLTPVVYTSYSWLQLNADCSIFRDAVELTGIRPFIDINLKLPDQEFGEPVTLLVEPNSTFNKFGVHSVQDLAAMISPGNSDYTNPLNPLYSFMAYHVLNNRMFINDFEGKATNYNTFSEVPIYIDGTGLEIGINRGKQVFDTIVSGADSTIIDYIGILYDESNITTQSGAIHFIDRIMTQQPASRSQIDYHWREEAVINTIRGTIGTYNLEQYRNDLKRLQWSGAELFFIREGTESVAASDDYLRINGDFEITYTIPRIVQGRYDIVLRAESYRANNALVEVYIDGKKLGSIVDLTSGGTASSPYRSITLGSVNFNRYAEHTIQIKSVIPGRFLWDYIRFVPS